MIKIENPKTGDDTRAWGPPFAKPVPEFATSGYVGESAYFLSVVSPVDVLTLQGQSEQKIRGFEFQASTVTGTAE